MRFKPFALLLAVTLGCLPTQAQNVWTSIKQKVKQELNNAANQVLAPNSPSSGDPNASYGVPGAYSGTSGSYPGAVGSYPASGYPSSTPPSYATPATPSSAIHDDIYGSAPSNTGPISSGNGSPTVTGGMSAAQHAFGGSANRVNSGFLERAYLQEQGGQLRNLGSDPSGAWRAACSQAVPRLQPIYAQEIELPSVRYMLPYLNPNKSGPFMQYRKDLDAKDAAELGIKKYEEFDPLSHSWEHYLSYNLFLQELGKKGKRTINPEEIKENDARSMFLYNESLQGIDPAIVARWQPVTKSWTTTHGKFGAKNIVEHNVTVKWGVQGSNGDTVTWQLH